jgi:hypothetical protein
MGGAGNDIVLSGAGNDILFGDGGSVIVTGGGTNVLIASIDPTVGGNDTIDGGAGLDILIGGQGDDLLFGSLDEDLLFGGNVAVTLAGGIVTNIETDTQDLVSESLFGGFSALKKKILGEEEFFDTIAAIIERMKNEAGLALQLDAELFRRLLDLSTDSTQMVDAGDVVLLSNPFNASGVIGPVAPGHGDGGEQGGGSESSAPSGAALVPSGEQLSVGSEEEQDSQILAAALGAAGLFAVQRPQANRPRTSAVRERKSHNRPVGSFPVG